MGKTKINKQVLYDDDDDIPEVKEYKKETKKGSKKETSKKDLKKGPKKIRDPSIPKKESKCSSKNIDNILLTIFKIVDESLKTKILVELEDLLPTQSLFNLAKKATKDIDLYGKTVISMLKEKYPDNSSSENKEQIKKMWNKLAQIDKDVFINESKQSVINFFNHRKNVTVKEGYIFNPYTGNQIKATNANGIKIKEMVDKILIENNEDFDENDDVILNDPKEHAKKIKQQERKKKNEEILKKNYEEIIKDTEEISDDEVDEVEEVEEVEDQEVEEVEDQEVEEVEDQEVEDQEVEEVEDQEVEEDSEVENHEIEEEDNDEVELSDDE